jgi:very-short-patch-repair endonuclease
MPVTKEQAKKEFREYYEKKNQVKIKTKFKTKNKNKELKALRFTFQNNIEPSVAEDKIITILLDNKIQFYREVSFSACRNPETKAQFRFDFYLPKHNLIIEYDGAHHQDEYFQYADGLKNSFCKSKNIRLLRLNKEHWYKLEESILKQIRTLRK